MEQGCDATNKETHFNPILAGLDHARGATWSQHSGEGGCLRWKGSKGGDGWRRSTGREPGRTEMCGNITIQLALWIVLATTLD